MFNKFNYYNLFNKFNYYNGQEKLIEQIFYKFKDYSELADLASESDKLLPYITLERPSITKPEKN